MGDKRQNGRDKSKVKRQRAERERFPFCSLPSAFCLGFGLAVLPFSLNALSPQYPHRIRPIPILRLRLRLFLFHALSFTRRQEQVLLQPMLLRVKLEVSTLQRVQLFVTPALENPSLFDHENLLRPANR